jgi:hypothetical protein
MTWFYKSMNFKHLLTGFSLESYKDNFRFTICLNLDCLSIWIHFFFFRSTLFKKVSLHILKFS